MKINFILPFADQTGGTAVILQHAFGLGKLGHDVRVYYPLLPYSIYCRGGSTVTQLLRRMKWFMKNLFLMNESSSWFPQNVSMSPVPKIANLFVRDADAVIATAWPTAYSVFALKSSKGQKYYFVQDYETWDGNIDAVDGSYRLPLIPIVIAPWIKELLEEKFRRNVEAEIHNGLDLDLFIPAASKSERPITILMMHHTKPYKGTEDGLAVLSRLHGEHPDVKVKMFGTAHFHGKPDFVEYHQSPRGSALVKLYQSSHIFLSPSVREGWGLPIMEAMGCGCAVVATRTGCVPVLEKDGNLLSAAPGDRDDLYAKLISLIIDPVKLRNVAERGHDTILHYRWPQFTKQLEKFLFESFKKSQERF